MENIINYSIEQLENIVLGYGESKFRAKQLFEWLHKKNVWHYDEMSNLSKPLREKLKVDWPLPQMKIIEKYESQIDGTIKYLFELSDSHIIESVLMRYKHGNSICISSQVGCRMGCKFCASTLDGLARNLEVSEMLGQIYFVSKDIGERISNVVIMGSGEPLEYLDTTKQFIRQINHEKGYQIGQRHIAISTCGLVPAIKALADEKFQVTLAISLHAGTDEKRQTIMPIARKYSIEELLDACRYYIQQTGRRITFEYALIQGENDTKEDAMQLVKLLKGMLCHVNLIPVNPVKEREYKASLSQSVENFADVLQSNHIETTVRRRLGQDIDAACGQLRRRYLENRGD